MINSIRLIMYQMLFLYIIIFSKTLLFSTLIFIHILLHWFSYYYDFHCIVCNENCMKINVIKCVWILRWKTTMFLVSNVIFIHNYFLKNIVVFHLNIHTHFITLIFIQLWKLYENQCNKMCMNIKVENNNVFEKIIMYKNNILYIIIFSKTLLFSTLIFIHILLHWFSYNFHCIH
jgi:hypothetical protein